MNTSVGNSSRIVVDVLVAPREAFEAICAAPSWRVALGAVLLIYVAAALATLPALEHAFDVSWPETIAKIPGLSSLTVPQLEQHKEMGKAALEFSWIPMLVAVPAGLLVQSMAMFAATSIAKGNGRFQQLWAASCNIAIISALGAAIRAIIIIARGPGAFNSVQSFHALMPSLAIFISPDNARLWKFCSYLDPLRFWQFVVLAIALVVIGRISKPYAICASAVILLTGPIVGAILVR